MPLRPYSPLLRSEWAMSDRDPNAAPMTAQTEDVNALPREGGRVPRCGDRRAQRDEPHLEHLRPALAGIVRVGRRSSVVRRAVARHQRVLGAFAAVAAISCARVQPVTVMTAVTPIVAPSVDAPAANGPRPTPDSGG